MPESQSGTTPPNLTSSVKASNLTDDPTETNDRIDLYLRMNMDSERDYCFSVPASAPVSFLYSIFDTLPIPLHPGYFFHPRPRGFAVSVHPGYLTAEGAILFSDHSMNRKWIKPVADSDRIGDVFVEGQLAVPIWRKHYRHELLTVLVLLIWLYLDLPEFITPTPGTAPSIWLYKFIGEFILTPQIPSQEVSIFNGVWWQCLFFALHIIKVAFIYYILWNGAWSPNTLNPSKMMIERSRKFVAPSPDELRKIGWTGARRTPKGNWPETYRDYRNDRVGGLMAAFRLGLLAKPIGIDLQPGEGWNALAEKGGTAALNAIEVEKDLLDSEGRFVVSQPYFKALAAPLADRVLKEETEEGAQKAIRDFRSFGFLDGPGQLTDLFDLLVTSVPAQS